MKSRELSSVELLALATFKLMDHDDVRNKVSAGEYPIDMIVNVQGAVRVSEDYSASPVVRCPTTLAMLMLILETQGDDANMLCALVRANLPKYLNKAASLMDNKADAILMNFGVPQAELAYADKIKQKEGKQPRKGPVVTSLVVEGLNISHVTNAGLSVAPKRKKPQSLKAKYISSK